MCGLQVRPPPLVYCLRGHLPLKGDTFLTKVVCAASKDERSGERWGIQRQREEQHSAVGNETGETAHVERCNNTLRQRFARFVRKTLSFSKSWLMHEACLQLFLHRYNLERAAILL